MSTTLEKFLSNALETLCAYLDAEKDSIIFSLDKGKYHECNTYKRIIPSRELKNIVNEDMYIFLNEKYSSAYDFVLHQAVDSFYQITTKFLIPYKTGEYEFYDSKSRKTIDFVGLAQIVHSEIQEKILNSITSSMGIDFENIILLSEMLYESDSAKGSIAFCLKNNLNKKELKNTYLHFSEDNAVIFSLDNIRYIRKLLAGAVNDNTLLFVRNNNNEYICYGYVSSKCEWPCTIQFEHGSSLIFKHKSTKLFRIKNRKVLCLQNKLSFYINEIKKEFGLKKDNDIDQVIRSINEQKHGTSIIFMKMSNDRCKSRMESLANSCRAVRTDIVNNTLCKNGNKALTELTRIDGATVINMDNESDLPRIPYVNVIVDGLVSPPRAKHTSVGDYSFGARHNAIVCFIDSFVLTDENIEIAALVFSESGTINLIKGSERRKRILSSLSK